MSTDPHVPEAIEQPITNAITAISDAVSSNPLTGCNTASRLDGAWHVYYPEGAMRMAVVQDGKFRGSSGEIVITGSGDEFSYDWGGEYDVKQSVTLDTDSPEFGKKGFEFSWTMSGSGAKEGDFRKWVRAAPVPAIRDECDIPEKATGIDGVWRLFGPNDLGYGIEIEVRGGKFWYEAGGESKMYQALPEGDNQWMIKWPNSGTVQKATVSENADLHYCGATIQWTCEHATYTSEKWVRVAEGPAPNPKDFVAPSDSNITGFWKQTIGESTTYLAAKEFTFLQGGRPCTITAEGDNLRLNGSTDEQGNVTGWRTFPASSMKCEEFTEDGFVLHWALHGSDSSLGQVTWERISTTEFLFNKAMNMIDDRDFSKLYYLRSYKHNDQPVPSYLDSMIFGCCMRPFSNLDWVVCYPCMFSKTMGKVSKGPDGGFTLADCLFACITMPLPPCIGCHAMCLRKTFQENYHVVNMNAVENLIYGCCCPLCSNTQIWRELENKKSHDGKSLAPGGVLCPTMN